MSREALVERCGRGLGIAIAGVVFCDFIGVLLFSLGSVGGILGLATMLIGGPYSAWMALEGHPRRRSLVRRIAIGHTLFLVATAVALFALAMYVLSTVQWG